MDSSDAGTVRTDAPAGLFLDRAGRWFHDGQRVAHRRLEDLLHRSIARMPDGHGLMVTTGRDQMPFVAEDAPFSVRAFVPGAEATALALSDGTLEPLGSRRFLVDSSGLVRCAVRGGGFWAILSRSATQILATYLADDGAALGGPFAGCVLVEAPLGFTRWDGCASSAAP